MIGLLVIYALVWGRWGSLSSVLHEVWGIGSVLHRLQVSFGTVGGGGGPTGLAPLLLAHDAPMYWYWFCGCMGGLQQPWPTISSLIFYH